MSSIVTPSPRCSSLCLCYSYYYYCFTVFTIEAIQQPIAMPIGTLELSAIATAANFEPDVTDFADLATRWFR